MKCSYKHLLLITDSLCIYIIYIFCRIKSYYPLNCLYQIVVFTAWDSVEESVVEEDNNGRPVAVVKEGEDDEGEPISVRAVADGDTSMQGFACNSSCEEIDLSVSPDKPQLKR